MKEIKFLISEDQYERINNIANWMNTRNFIVNGQDDNNRNIEMFFRGAGLLLLEEIENINPKVSPNIRSETKFRNRFKEIAKDRGIRQIDIAETLNVEKSYISLIFNNKAQPGSELFFKIWVLLRCPPIYKTFYFED